MDTLKLLHDTTQPFENLEYEGIEYTVCKDYSHISRYKRLRQVIHYLDDPSRFVTLETQNDYSYEGVEIEYYTVPVDKENRLDLISYEFYGTPTYSWVISYVNQIPDGYTVHEGQVLLIPTSISQLFGSGSVLSSVPATKLNLGAE